MPINDPLDVTPASSFTSFQFQSEILNIFVSSMLISLILFNIESLISKLMQQTPRHHFSFDTFRRFMLFSNSDDPIRIISFLRGKYPFYTHNWKQYEQRINLKLLLWPLSARLFLLAVAIGSIAAAVPRESILSGCENGDFRIAMKFSPILNKLGGDCTGIPLVTSLGKMSSTLRQCKSLSSGLRPNATGSRQLTVQFHEDGRYVWAIKGPKWVSGEVSYFQWRNREGRSFYSLPSFSISPEQFLDILVLGPSRVGLTCGHGSVERIQTGNGIIAEANTVLTGDCANTDIHGVFPPMVDIVSVSFYIEKVDQSQTRYDPARQQLTTECPIQISVVRPLVSIFALSVTLIAIVVFNTFVRLLVSKRGNITDGWYHIVKEVLGYDCMSNAIEDSKGACSVTNTVRMQRVIRDDHGHVGFVREYIDDEVGDFESDTIVY